MIVGQKVYTVNAKTNKVDEWTYAGNIRNNDELLIHLTRGTTYLFLPARVVYESKEKALSVAAQ